MGFLSTSDLAGYNAIDTGLQGSLDLSLPDTCTINTLTRTPNSQGGFTASYTAGSATPCRIEPLRPKTGQERYAAGRVQSELRWMITLPVTATVSALDTITITTQANRVYQVTAVEKDRSYPISIRCICEHIS